MTTSTLASSGWRRLGALSLSLTRSGRSISQRTWITQALDLQLSSTRFSITSYFRARDPPTSKIAFHLDIWKPRAIIARLRIRSCLTLENIAGVCIALVCVCVWWVLRSSAAAAAADGRLRAITPIGLYAHSFGGQPVAAARLRYNTHTSRRMRDGRWICRRTRVRCVLRCLHLHRTRRASLEAAACSALLILEKPDAPLELWRRRLTFSTKFVSRALRERGRKIVTSVYSGLDTEKVILRERRGWNAFVRFHYFFFPLSTRHCCCCRCSPVCDR